MQCLTQYNEYNHVICSLIFIIKVAHFMTKLKRKQRGHCFFIFILALLNSSQNSDQLRSEKAKRTALDALSSPVVLLKRPDLHPQLHSPCSLSSCSTPCTIKMYQRTKGIFSEEHI